MQALVLATLLCAASAAADEGASAAPAPDVRLAPDWSLTIGAGALATPSYPGAASMRLIPMPFVDLRYRELFFLSPIAGMGVNAVATRSVRVGIAVLPDFGRSASADDRLRGWGDVTAGANLKLFGMYSLGRLNLLAAVRRQLGAGNGTLIEAGLATSLPVARHLLLLPAATLTWADARYARSYFGIDPNQSSAALAQGTALPAYAAGAGLRDATLALAAVVPVDDRWSVHSVFRAGILLGDAAASPLTARRIQPMAGAFLAYRL